MTAQGDRRPACFLDRDGTLTEERGYAATAAAIALLPGAAQAVRRLNTSGVAAVLITNQSGIGRGYFSHAAVAAQHAALEALLARDGAGLDGIYVCPHHPAAGCGCRKPGTALLERAAAELGLDLARSYMIGDRPADVECGERAAAGGFLVLTGYGQQSLEAPGRRFAADAVCRDVEEAVERVLERLGRLGG